MGYYYNYEQAKGRRENTGICDTVLKSHAVYVLLLHERLYSSTYSVIFSFYELKSFLEYR